MPAGSAAASFDPDPRALARAADADRVVSGAGAQLNYLSQVSVSLGLPDPVQEYFGPVVGRWRELHEEAGRWRRAARSVEELGHGVTAPLGQLDAVWHGQVSESFVDHMSQVGRAATSASDAMTAMAEALDTTAGAMHQLVTDTVDLLAGGADRVSLALLLPADGEARAGQHIGELRRHARRILDAAHELLAAFAQLCQGTADRQPFAGVVAATTFPERNWTFAPPPPPGTDLPAPGSGPADGDRPGMAGTGGSAAGPGTAGAVATPVPAAPPEPSLRTFAAEPSAAAAGAAQPSAGSPVAGAALAGGQRGPAGAAAPFLPFVPGMGAGQGGDTERRSTSGVTADPAEIFGEPTRTAPPVIGED